MLIGRQGKRAYIRRQKRRGRNINEKYIASCYGKIRYESYAAAKAANSGKLDKVRPYKCQYCKYHHVGRYNGS